MHYPEWRRPAPDYGDGDGSGSSDGAGGLEGSAVVVQCMRHKVTGFTGLAFGREACSKKFFATTPGITSVGTVAQLGATGGGGGGGGGDSARHVVPATPAAAAQERMDRRRSTKGSELQFCLHVAADVRQRGSAQLLYVAESTLELSPLHECADLEHPLAELLLPQANIAGRDGRQRSDDDDDEEEF